jgi:hypothetical protein
MRAVTKTQVVLVAQLVGGDYLTEVDLRVAEDLSAESSPQEKRKRKNQRTRA